MKKLLSILGGVAMVGTAGISVVSCEKPKKAQKEEDVKKKLGDTITSTKTEQTKIKDSLKKTGWTKDEEPKLPIALETELNDAIEEAETISKKSEVNKEEAKNSIERLQKALDKYSDALPQNILAEAINKRKEDIKSIIHKDWSYAQLFGIDKAKDLDGNPNIMDLIHKDTYDIAISKGYSHKEAGFQGVLENSLANYLQNFVDLVYINVDENGNQKINNKVVDTGASLENLFLDQVKFDYKTELTKEGELPKDFFKDPKHTKLSLGISFPQGHKDFPMPEGTKSFWTFTFFDGNFNSKKDALQELFTKESNANGLVFKTKVGLEEDAFKEALDVEMKNFLWGKHYLPKDITIKIETLPNKEKIEKGTAKEGEKIKSDFIFLADGKELFRINTTYTIIIMPVVEPFA